jgi:hypothetical protein
MGMGHADARVCRRIGALKAKRDLLRRLDNSVARLMQYDDQLKHLMRVARSEKSITAGSK